MQTVHSMSLRSGHAPMLSPDPGRSRSHRRSISPRDNAPSAIRSPGRADRRDRSRSLNRSPSRGRTRSRSRSRDRRHRSRSYSRTPSRSPPRSSKIVVEKLTKNVSEGHLREIFGSFGDIESLDLPMNKAFMTNRGTAYILYYDPADAEAAIAHMHEAQLDGAILNVSIILPRRNFSRSPPSASNRGNDGRAKYGRASYAGNLSPRRQPRARPTERHDVYRPRSLSRSRSPRRSRSYSPSRSRSPPRRGSLRRESPRHRRRRSPSYSSYSTRSGRSRSRNRSRSRSRSRH